MEESEARPAGWHPDPEDPSMLRHWNGKRWGRVRRPRPSWASGPGDESSAPPAPTTPVGPPGLPRRWWVWAVGAAVLVFGVPVLMLQVNNRGPDLPPRTVEDQEFVGQANAVCRRILDPLQEERQDRGRNRQLGNEAAVADRIEQTAGRLGELIGELRRIPVAADDWPDVTRWIDDWDAYVAVGHRYAEALRRQDEQAYPSITEESRDLGIRVFVFARANGMPECTP